MRLDQSTARTRMFLMVLTSDHVTGATGKTVTLTLSKNGAAFGAAGGSVTEVSSGWYKVDLNTTDTGTVGDLAYHATAADSDPTDFVDEVKTTDATITTIAAATEVYKKNVAVTAFVFGMIKTDGTQGTSLTVAGRITKDGAASAAIAGAITEIDNGFYKVDLTQAEMNADEVGLVFTATGARPTMLKIRTQS